ncbi:MAG: TIGR00730 family Rossman fold protein [Planctomycetes bacterium]|nr:TIGR00730 family Rossman fold protein [Planctomycetota bacterium]
MTRLRRVCVFCGSAPGARPAYAAAARAFGALLARRGIDLVWGGGNVGLMGAVADAALAAGGRALGVIPEALAERELAHVGATELHVVRTMHERKALMADLSDAFAALPGGLGTLDETFEILTWAQLGLHAKPVGLLDVEGYWGPLLGFLDDALDEGFVRPADRARILVEHDPARLLEELGRERVPLRR